MKADPAKRFAKKRGKNLTWLWHRTSKGNLAKIKRTGIRPGISGGLGKDPRVKVVNKLFDRERPKGLKYSRGNSVFLDIPDVQKMRRAFESIFLEPEKRRGIKERYARALVNPKKILVGDMDIVIKAHGLLDKQISKTRRRVSSASDVSGENLKQIRILGKKYWQNAVTLEEFLKRYEWVPLPTGGYKPKTGSGALIKNPEAMAPAGKTIKDVRVSKGRV